MLWWLSHGEGWMPLHDAVGINCKKGATTENQDSAVKHMGLTADIIAMRKSWYIIIIIMLMIVCVCLLSGLTLLPLLGRVRKSWNIIYYVP